MIEEVVGFVFRAAAGVATEYVIERVGRGDSTAAAFFRALLCLACAAVSAMALWFLISDMITADWELGSLVLALVLITVGGLASLGCVRNIRSLLHWGEPVVVSDGYGLHFPGLKRRAAWRDIVSLRVGRGKRRVVIETAGTSSRPIVIATRRPESLIAAILADPRALPGQRLDASAKLVKNA